MGILHVTSGPWFFGWGLGTKLLYDESNLCKTLTADCKSLATSKLNSGKPRTEREGKRKPSLVPRPSEVQKCCMVFTRPPFSSWRVLGWRLVASQAGSESLHSQLVVVITTARAFATQRRYFLPRHINSSPSSASHNFMIRTMSAIFLSGVFYIASFPGSSLAPFFFRVREEPGNMARFSHSESLLLTIHYWQSTYIWSCNP